MLEPFVSKGCGHDTAAATVRVCPHLMAENDDVPDPVGLLTGRGLEHDVVCADCAASGPAALTEICADCAGDLSGHKVITAWFGRPEILDRPEPLNTTVSRWPLPRALGETVGLAPVHGTADSTWLALTADGRIAELKPDADRVTVLATVDLAPEPPGEPWMGHEMRPRLLVSDDGRFAAVVRDYGRFGQVLELAGGGLPTMALDGGEYRPETVPFSAAFAVVDGRTVLVHRTAWNRLDVSDPGTGELLTPREHHLDYFHGRLHVSPGGRAILDDGWVWSPIGVPMVWSLPAWLDGNAAEPEDGPSLRALCQREYHWDSGMCFVGDDRVAISGIGADDDALLPGARVFSVDSGEQLTAFAGPAGAFLSDRRWLYSVADGATQVWDPATGHRTATIPGFTPTCLHHGTGELAGITGGVLLRRQGTASTGS